eukprot:Nitzschia sp. Nitz4//scaffold3_size479765//173549//174619//NITZ4_000071-RA/size479765-processed-gene-0.75-mRNA-1//1//CDS//3329550671//2216//frame0
MNNQDFQKLVRDRAGVNGSKEIARAAVEAEFKRKKKKRRRGGGGDDDYSSDSDDERKPAPKKEKSELLFRPQQVKAKPLGDDEEASKYRDRAKERRELGIEKPPDDPSEEALGNQKGLDLNLVRQAKKQLQEQHTPTTPDLPTTELPNPDQAKQVLASYLDDPFSTPSIPAGLAEYLMLYSQLLSWESTLVDKVPFGRPGQDIQHSRLVMTMLADPADPIRAWEVPRPGMASDTVEHGPIPMLDNSLLDSIDLVFSKNKRKATQMAKSVLQSSQSTSARPNIEQQDKKDVPVPADDDDIFAGLGDYVPPKASSQTTETSAESPGEKAATKQVATNDDDDDIFGGLDEYVPPAAPKE